MLPFRATAPVLVRVPKPPSGPGARVPPFVPEVMLPTAPAPASSAGVPASWFSETPLVMLPLTCKVPPLSVVGPV